MMLSKRSGFSLIELIFVLLIIAGIVAVVVNSGTKGLDDSEIENYVGKSSMDMANSLPKFKQGYYKSGKKYSNLTENTLQSFATPLVYDVANDTITPEGYSDIKYYAGSHTSDTRAYVCMDATTMDWDSVAKGTAEQKFASVMQTAYPTSIIDGTATVEYASANDAETATATEPDDDGFICVTTIR